MSIEITNLEAGEELNEAAMSQTRGALQLSPFVSSRLSSSPLVGAMACGTKGTKSVCHIDGTVDCDSSVLALSMF